MTNVIEQLQDYSHYFNQALPSFFELPQGAEKRVAEAMLYSVANGGKRIRPFLVAQTALLFGITPQESLRTAMALEMLHSYSLVHDDLPSMDNDDLRRGQPTCHKKFDDATAILAGDGLLTYAFEILSDSKTISNPATRCELISLLSNAAGAYNGMVAGQMLDLYSEKNFATHDQEAIIYRIEEMKTGRLLRFACEAGAVLGSANQKQRQALITYSRKIGMTFQIADDILDIEGNPQLVGKTLNKDAAQGKLTFVSLYGLEPARQIAQKLTSEAIEALQIFGTQAQTLQDLATFIIERKS